MTETRRLRLRIRPARAGSESGIPGVRPKNVRGIRYWMVEWYPQTGIPKRKLFSVRKYGEAAARALAERERELQISILFTPTQLAEALAPKRANHEAHLRTGQ